ncbi:phosphotransferase family protein [Actinomadura craniellae]|uniref:phosphotransferase family protein n=1 Tax=Actinomadura craniellae TaxID=2231787 RepID=UPI001F464833|nr:aminoglycoside phosphotransferase family protein [Actinomadura craniellae]
MTTAEPPCAATLRWVEECLGSGSVVKMVRPLLGGDSHVNHALLVETRSGIGHRLVLRRWAHPGEAALDHHEFSPEREIAALALLAGCEIPTPCLVAADPSGVHCDAPALLITRLIGHPPRPSSEELPEYLIQLAAALLAVHAVKGGATMPPYIPHNRLDSRLPPRAALRPQLWDRAFEIAAGPAPAADAHFIHRDYHPDNTLWSNGRLTGIVDWSSASYGPAAVDIAHMRRDLTLQYGVGAADRFLDTFDQVSGGYTHDPYWDVRCVVDLLPETCVRAISDCRIPVLEEYLISRIAQITTSPW